MAETLIGLILLLNEKHNGDDAPYDDVRCLLPAYDSQSSAAEEARMHPWPAPFMALLSLYAGLIPVHGAEQQY